MDVLDVACGTGVMFPYYLERGVRTVTGIDISPRMAEIARDKFQQDSRVQVICGDVEEAVFDKKFDVIMVYNAFPHFPDPRRLIKTLTGLLKEGGRLSIAHGASREAIDNHHQGAASKVSNGLMSAQQLKKLFDPHLEVEVMISNRRMYQLSGVKCNSLQHSHGDHAHTHEYLGDHDHESEAPMDEMLALMKFMVAHNDAHAQELAELAQRLKETGRVRAYTQIMDAVTDFDMVNAKLDGIFNELNAQV
jgi:demethylmenaquinone methyltransferase/2-methoxy-6-polyprenyl-1,4-benzoquinol methylase